PTSAVMSPWAGLKTSSVFTDLDLTSLTSLQWLMRLLDMNGLLKLIRSWFRGCAPWQRQYQQPEQHHRRGDTARYDRRSARARQVARVRFARRHRWHRGPRRGRRPAIRWAWWSLP